MNAPSSLSAGALMFQHLAKVETPPWSRSPGAEFGSGLCAAVKVSDDCLSVSAVGPAPAKQFSNFRR